jgi:hypothetical protein
MIIATILFGFALETVPLDELARPGWYMTYYECVRFEVWGTLVIDTTGKGKHKVLWDTRHPRSWRNYLKARAELARTPVPYGVAYHGKRCRRPCSCS